MSSVSGILSVGEAQGALRAIGRRQRGSAYVFYGLMLGLMIAGAIAGFTIDEIWHPPDGHMGLAVGVAIGGLVYMFGCRRLLRARFRSRLAARGIALDLPLSMEITQDALCYKVGGVEHRAQWSAVTEFFESHGYWIFLVQSSPWFAPKRFFSDRNAERDFIREALSHMSEGARSRSADAVAFAEDAAK